MARGIAWGVLQGCVVIFLEFPHLDVEIAIVRKLPIPATKKSWYCLEAGDNAMQDLPNLERIVMDGFQETRHWVFGAGIGPKYSLNMESSELLTFKFQNFMDHIYI